MKVKLKLFFVVVQNEQSSRMTFVVWPVLKKRELHVMYEVFVAPIIFVKLRSPL